MADLNVTVGADISAYKAGMQEVGNVAKSTSNEVTRDLANAAKATESLGGSAQSASMRFMQMRSGISAARDGVMAFTLGGQAAERSLMAMGHHINSLINETGSLRGAFSALASSLIGPGGVILAITLAAELWNKYQESQKNAAEEQTAYQKAVESANTEAAKEISSLQSLYEAATNANIPMSQRIEAVKQLQSEYPAYFANMSQEAILAGKAAVAYDNLTQSIINQAVVKAGQERLQEAIKPLVDIIAEQERLKVQIDKNNAEAAAKNPNRVISTGASGQEGFREIQVIGHTNQVAMQTFVEDQTKAGQELHGKTLQTMEQYKADLQKGIKEAADTVQQMVKDFGINSLIDPDKMKKDKEAVTGLDLLKQKLKEAETALQDSIVAGETGKEDFNSPLLKQIQTLQAAIDKAMATYNILMGLAPRNDLLTAKGLGSERGFGNGLDNGGLLENSGVRQFSDDQLGNAGLGKTNDEVVSSMQKGVKAFQDQTNWAYDASNAIKEYNAELKATNNVVSIFGGGLTRAFETALSGTQSFVSAMGQFLLQLVEKLIAAAAAAALLDVLLAATGFGAGTSFVSIFGQLSGFKNLLGGTSSGSSSIQGFATGGIFSQSTIGMFAERGPEAIVTPEHLAEFANYTSQSGVSGANDTITVTHRISGSDLLLTINRATKTQGRTS